MTLDKFDYVLALAEEKSLTKAAKRLYISQPGLTTYINKLEEHLGIKLFDRSVTPIQVTDAGMIYISRMKKIQREEALLKLKLKDMSSNKRIFRVGIGMTRGVQWLPVILPKFHAMYPDVVVQIHEGGLEELENGVSMGNYDLAFGALNTGYPGVVYETLGKEPIYCVVPRSEERIKDIPKDKATIDEPMLIEGSRLDGALFLMPNPNNGMFGFTAQVMAQYNINPGQTINLSVLETAYQLAGKGVGALFINAVDFNKQYPQYTDKLAFFKFEEAPLYRQSAVGYKEKSPNEDLIKDMVDIVRQSFYS